MPAACIPGRIVTWVVAAMGRVTDIHPRRSDRLKIPVNRRLRSGQDRGRVGSCSRSSAGLDRDGGYGLVAHTGHRFTAIGRTILRHRAAAGGAVPWLDPGQSPLLQLRNHLRHHLGIEAVSALQSRTCPMSIAPPIHRTGPGDRVKPRDAE